VNGDNYSGGQSGGEREEISGGGDDLKLAGFYVGEGLYGIEIMRIKEVIQAAPHPVRAVPLAPAIVEGVIQLRGVVIPVVDLRRRFGTKPNPEYARVNKLIIVSVGGRIAGLLVDRVIGELRVSAKSVRPAPSLLRPPVAESATDEMFSGVCRVGEDMVFLLNLEAMLRV
jgi:purine-binding chemotaxis protein CheW